MVSKLRRAARRAAGVAAFCAAVLSVAGASAYCITTKNNPWSNPTSAKNIVFSQLVPS